MRSHFLASRLRSAPAARRIGRAGSSQALRQQRPPEVPERREGLGLLVDSRARCFAAAYVPWRRTNARYVYRLCAGRGGNLTLLLSTLTCRDAGEGFTGTVDQPNQALRAFVQFRFGAR